MVRTTIEDMFEFSNEDFWGFLQLLIPIFTIVNIGIFKSNTFRMFDTFGLDQIDYRRSVSSYIVQVFGRFVGCAMR